MPDDIEGGGASQSTQPAAGSSSATDISLRQHIMGLLHERDRALEMAGVEREKAAAALREGTNAKIAALEKLLRALIDAKATEFHAVHAASQTAIAKAEESIQRRLDLLNEFRAQIADEATKYALREVVEAQFTDLRRQIAELTEKLGKLV